MRFAVSVLGCLLQEFSPPSLPKAPLKPLGPVDVASAQLYAGKTCQLKVVLKNQDAASPLLFGLLFGDYCLFAAHGAGLTLFGSDMIHQMILSSDKARYLQRGSLAALLFLWQALAACNGPRAKQQLSATLLSSLSTATTKANHPNHATEEHRMSVVSSVVTS
eukprot:5122578-Amphidinium_carterae.1